VKRGRAGWYLRSNNEQIDVAVRPRFAACDRTDQPDVDCAVPGSDFKNGIPLLPEGLPDVRHGQLLAPFEV
jgi:hypothetical protein